jgi:hypothetical protein
MTPSIEKRIAAIEARRKGTGKREPSLGIKWNNGEPELETMQMPVGLDGWRKATAAELAECRKTIAEVMSAI